MSARDIAIRARNFGTRNRAEHAARLFNQRVVNDFELMSRLPPGDPGRAAIAARMALQQTIVSVLRYVLDGTDPGFAFAPGGALSMGEHNGDNGGERSRILGLVNQRMQDLAALAAERRAAGLPPYSRRMRQMSERLERLRNRLLNLGGNVVEGCC